METHRLLDKTASAEFYETRYANGYMDDWDLAKKQRVAEVIGRLGLAQEGKALDFGCGNGVFTDVIQKVLPGWQVYGTDISKVALDNAKRRYPAATFFELSNASSLGTCFDFIFSHHVLEHVPDLQLAAELIAEMSAERATLLHILPCGNAGSFEHKLCSLRKDGIDPKLGNRFFFEDDGHVRRLTSAELVEIFVPFGFRYLKGFFANQYEGAFDWISDYSEEFINDLTDPDQAITPASALELLAIKRQLLAYKQTKAKALAYRANGIPYIHGLRSLGTMVKSYWQAYRANQWYEAAKQRLANEWKSKGTEENGSEMFLALQRTNPPGNVSSAND
jgi:SAM-dependent methyltransferase